MVKDKSLVLLFFIWLASYPNTIYWMISFPLLFKKFILIFLNCTLGSGVHVQIMQDCCIGTYMARWFAASNSRHLYVAFLPILSLPNLPTTNCSSPAPKETLVCNAPLPVSMCSHCSTPACEWEHAVFDFLFLCQFAENDVFQIHPCLYKGHELIFFMAA